MNRLLYYFVFIFLISCNSENQFPEPVSEKVSPEQVTVLEKLKLSEQDSNITLSRNDEKGPDFGQLNHFQDLYFEKDSEFNLTDFENEWADISRNIENSKMNLSDAENWFEINGTLFLITGEAKYSEEMENIISTGFSPSTETEYKEIENLVAPYIFTKNVDHIHINLFTPAEIQYEHTLHGKVKIWQETDYPDSDNVTIKFSMEKHRYIEVFVRIPSWAQNATVTAMGVKYFAPPGEYALIAKQWHEGDSIEIHFPSDKKLAEL